MNCYWRCKRFFAESLQQPIHPVWLELKDKELQREFDMEQSRTILHRMKIGAVALWILCAIVIIHHLRTYGSIGYEIGGILYV